MGCACDACKLLLSNIPVSVTETALISALSQFGHVVQLGLTPDSAGVSRVPCCLPSCSARVQRMSSGFDEFRHSFSCVCLRAWRGMLLLWSKGPDGACMHDRTGCRAESC